MTNLPLYHQQEEFKNRSLKLEDITKLNVPAYPHKFSPSHKALSIQKEFKDLELPSYKEAANAASPLVKIAGRIVLFRPMGKNIFAQIQDDTDRLQIMCNRDHTRLENYHPESLEEGAPSHHKFIEKKLDLGDIIGVEGYLFRTQKGEVTLFVKTLTLLCKTLLPLPDKHSGLEAKETRYRKRWLDLISNSSVKQSFITRSQILKKVRRYMENAGFIEVETPVLQSIYGGAKARPFTTQLHALNQDMFLRIALEIPLKKLLVGGMDRVFEMGKVFRNEGIDKNHNPEFTMMEAYASYWDYEDMMSFTENLFEKIALALFSSTKVPYTDEEGSIQTVDFKAPWIRLSMKDSLKKYAQIDVEAMTDHAMKTLLMEKKSYEEKDLQHPRGLLISLLFENFVEEHLIEPHHIIDHPIETTPLCKLHRNKKLASEGIVERFESYILKQEICNAYSELNDPQKQRELLCLQAKQKEAGDAEANPLDEEFLEAICQGMPPAGGVGIGIDRMVMLFTNALSIRDVLYFPWMKPSSKEA